MESTLWRTAVEEGEARGERRTKADTIIRILAYRIGAVAPTLRERIRGIADIETLTIWYTEALFVVDAEGARRLADKIQHAPVTP
jgi:hypothetical protein